MISPEWMPKVFPAYIDAGTGSLIFQVLIAGLVGGLFLLKVFWARVRSFFVCLFSRRREKDEDEDRD